MDGRCSFMLLTYKYYANPLPFTSIWKFVIITMLTLSTYFWNQFTYFQNFAKMNEMGTVYGIIFAVLDLVR